MHPHDQLQRIAALPDGKFQAVLKRLSNLERQRLFDFIRDNPPRCESVGATVTPARRLEHYANRARQAEFMSWFRQLPVTAMSAALLRLQAGDTPELVRADFTEQGVV
jgi:hypothetical protein